MKQSKVKVRVRSLEESEIVNEYNQGLFEPDNDIGLDLTVWAASIPDIKWFLDVKQQSFTLLPPSSGTRVKMRLDTWNHVFANGVALGSLPIGVALTRLRFLANRKVGTVSREGLMLTFGVEGCTAMLPNGLVARRYPRGDYWFLIDPDKKACHAAPPSRLREYYQVTQYTERGYGDMALRADIVGGSLLPVNGIEYKEI